MTELAIVTVGRGIKVARKDSIFIVRGSATVVGGVYMLAEDVVTDNATVTAENSNTDVGALANVVTPTSGVVAGLAATTAGGPIGFYVLATEAVIDGAPFNGLLEAYYVDALVTTGGSKVPRTSLYPTAGTPLNSTAPAIGSPVVGRLLVDVGTITAALTKVHFRGLPGGFGSGPGT